jgi:hypothetical protein
MDEKIIGAAIGGAVIAVWKFGEMATARLRNRRNNCKPHQPGSSPLCIEHAQKVASHERAIKNIDATLLRIEGELQSMNKHLLTLKR